MPSYTYKASTMEGKTVEGSMEALDDGTVSLKLQEMGLLPVPPVPFSRARSSGLGNEIKSGAKIC